MKSLPKYLLHVVLVAIIIANVITIQISQHDELRPITNGDLEIREAIENLPENSISIPKTTIGAMCMIYQTV